MIVDMVRMRYLDPNWYTLDATYGRGKWWTLFRPDRLVTVDSDPQSDAEYHHDFRDLPFPDGTRETGFDAATFDPAYIAPGGRKTSTIGKFNSAYGLRDCPRNPRELQAMNNDGLAEVARCLRRRNVGARARRDGTWHAGGLVLCKSMNYVEGGKLHPGTLLTWQFATEHLGLHLQDHFVHVGKPGPQPKKRGKHGDIESAQQHGRANTSHLLVFRKTT